MEYLLDAVEAKVKYRDMVTFRLGRSECFHNSRCVHKPITEHLVRVINKEDSC